jgi:hypothetical protein
MNSITQCNWCESTRLLFLKAEGFPSDKSVFTASHLPVRICANCGKVSIGSREK